MSSLIVIDKAEDWSSEIPGTEVVTAIDYLSNLDYSQRRHYRVYNLCQSYRYQSNGYYVSLLAAARGHRPLPDVTTIQDLKSPTVPRLLGEDLDDHIQKGLQPIESTEFELSIYFGQNLAKRHERLSKSLFNLFPAPLLRAKFTKGQKWQLRSLRAIPLEDIPGSHHEFLEEAARLWFARPRRAVKRPASARYDLAILVDESEHEPPSDARALRLFEKAAESLGFSVDFLDQDDFARIGEYDALFIRATTHVNDHTYRFARRAAVEGLVVIDDPDSILKCTNKVYMAERLAKLRIPTPPTMVVHKGNANEIVSRLGLPCVLKQPDSAFSLGVVKADNETDLKRDLTRLFERSELLVAQSFLPTDYDWRVGVLEGRALYVCRYFMAEGHWQIIQRDKKGEAIEGEHETMSVEGAPKEVVELGVRAALAVGDGLYGVDIKQAGSKLYVIEVNDNPSLDAGVEDIVLGEAMYYRIMETFLRRVETRARNASGG